VPFLDRSDLCITSPTRWKCYRRHCSRLHHSVSVSREICVARARFQNGATEFKPNCRPRVSNSLKMGYPDSAMWQWPLPELLALFLTHTNFSVSSGVGFLALFGVSVQTGVIMLKYINRIRARGHAVELATVESAVLRLRPIMMTVLVATLGLAPGCAIARYRKQFAKAVCNRDYR